jgi:Mg-chelatase subunit ChlD
MRNSGQEGHHNAMKDDYTHITVVLDRSGSMESIRDDIIGGFNAFLKEQQRTEGMATLTLVQFDTASPYEVVHTFTLVQAVKPLTAETYVPRGGTPLLDALGRGILELDATLQQMREENRPARVVFVIVTDGAENASREFTRNQIARMIAEKQEVTGWQFVFLSADLSAIAEGEGLGMIYQRSLAFDKTSKGSRAAFDSVSASVARMRQGVAEDVSFLEADRRAQENESRRTRK